MSDAVEIRPCSDGSIKEIIAKGCDLHIEQMTDDRWFVGIVASDGGYWQFWIGAKNGVSHVEARHMGTFQPKGNSPMTADFSTLPQE